MEYIFTTDGIPEPSREVRWGNEFLRVFDSPVRIERAQAQPFQGQIRSRELGEATLVSVQLEHDDARPHLIHHEPAVGRDGRPSLFVLAKLAGQSRYHYDGGHKLGRPGDVLVFDGDQPWASESPRGRHQTLVLKLDRESTLSQLGLATLPAVLALRAEQKLGGLIESYLRSMVRLDARLARTLGPRMVTQFCELLAMAIQVSARSRSQAQSQARTAQLASIREYLEQNLGDATLGPEVVASRFGISTRYLHKLHADQGQSFSRWLLQRRLERCRRDLDEVAQSQRSIAQIALDNGFNDLTHFGRCFRAAYGLTPREWRRYRPARPDQRQSDSTPASPASAPRRRAGRTAPPATVPLPEGGTEAARMQGQLARILAEGEAFTADFYERMFAAAPTSRALFEARSVDLGQQGAKLLRMLALMVANAATPGQLTEPFTQLGARHRDYGVSASDYVPMGEALVAALADHLGEAFGAEDRAAWLRLYARVVEIMVGSG